MRAKLTACPAWDEHRQAICNAPLVRIEGRFLIFGCGTMISIAVEEASHAMQGQEKKETQIQEAEKVKPGDPGTAGQHRVSPRAK